VTPYQLVEGAPVAGQEGLDPSRLFMLSHCWLCAVFIHLDNHSADKFHQTDHSHRDYIRFFRFDKPADTVGEKSKPAVNQAADPN
jgi:hypothetical protein